MANPVSRYSPPPPHPGPYQSPEPPPYNAQGPPSGFYPLTIGRTVSLAFSMYRFGWRTFVAISLIAAVPVVLIQSLVGLATYQAMADWQNSLFDKFGTLAPTNTPLSADVLATFPWQGVLLTFLISLPLGAITFVGGGALTHAIAAAFGGARLSTRESYRAALARLRDLLALYVVLAIIGAAWSLLILLVPLLTLAGPRILGGGGPAAFLALIALVALLFGIAFLLIRLVFAVQVLMLEGKAALDSVRRSYSLVAGSMLRVVGYALVFGVILALFAIAISFVSVMVEFVMSRPTLAVPAPALSPTTFFVESLITSLLAEVVAPILSIGFVLLYYDIRHRHGERVPQPGGG